jgi:UMF1 family MFS transporter
MVATFILVFSLPSFLLLPKDREAQMTVRQAAVWGLTSFRELWAEVMKEREMRRFLLAYFIYIDGVLTAYGIAATLAESTFGFTQDEQILLIIAVQFTALFGALTLAKPTDRIGPKKVLTGVLLLWVGAAIGIYFVSSKAAFAALALIAGVGLGAAQSVSRAFMASLIPKGRESEMFGFYALCGRSSSVIGPLIFGQVALRTGGNERLAVMAVSVLFVAGLFLLQRVGDSKAPAVATT